MIAVIETDVWECETQAVLLFDDVVAAAQYVATRFKLTADQRAEIEKEGYALVIPDKPRGGYRLLDPRSEEADCAYPRGSYDFDVVDRLLDLRQKGG